MDSIVKEDLQMLMNANAGWRVSVYLPTNPATKYNSEDPLRFKNLLRAAGEQLAANGMKKAAAVDFLRPAHGLLLDQKFWQNVSDGLAMFIGENGVINYFRLPLKFESLVHVGRHYHVKPLLPLFIEDGRFFVLALSQGSVRLLQGTHYNVSEIDLVGVPRSLREAMKYEIYEHLERHQRTAAGGSVRKGMAVFHGQGVGIADTKKDEILRYFRKIDRGLHEYLRSEKAPLILAGVEYLFPIYRSANTYPYLLPDAVCGNPEQVDVRKLHLSAWNAVKPYFQQGQRESLAIFRHLYGTDKSMVSGNLAEIIPAAYTGRVSALFVNNNVQRWGKYNPCTNTVVYHEKEEPGDEDLLDLAVSRTLLEDGKVFVVNAGVLPEDAPAGAIFRY